MYFINFRPDNIKQDDFTNLQIAVVPGTYLDQDNHSTCPIITPFYAELNISSQNCKEQSINGKWDAARLNIRFRRPVHGGCKQPIAGQKDSSYCEAQWPRRQEGELVITIFLRTFSLGVFFRKMECALCGSLLDRSYLSRTLQDSLNLRQNIIIKPNRLEIYHTSWPTQNLQKSQTGVTHPSDPQFMGLNPIAHQQIFQFETFM